VNSLDRNPGRTVDTYVVRGGGGNSFFALKEARAMGEEKKPSSLRKRIDRTRKAYEKKIRPTQIFVALVFVIIVAAVLAFAFRGKPAEYGAGAGRSSSQSSEQGSGSAVAPNPPGPAPSAPKTPEEAVDRLRYEAKELAKTDPDGAVAKLKASLGKWPEYDAELYCQMGYALPESRAAEKVEYYEKALGMIESGQGKFLYDPLKNRLQNLKRSIEVMKDKAGLR
jgi:hypothetical protein